jgi:hypothetical protein
LAINKVTSDSKKSILNLSTHILRDFEEAGPCKGFELFGYVSTLQPGHGMCCVICCFEASTDSGYEIQVEEQAHVREV